MLTATESAIRTLMAANPNNRVAVIGYSDRASVLLPLDHYQNGTEAEYFSYAPRGVGTGGTVTAYGINSSANPVENTFDIKGGFPAPINTPSPVFIWAHRSCSMPTPP